MPLAATDPIAFDSPQAVAVLATIGALLVVVLARELRHVLKSRLVLMAAAFLDMVGMFMVMPILPFYVKAFAADGVTLFGHRIAEGMLTGLVVSARRKSKHRSRTTRDPPPRSCPPARDPVRPAATARAHRSPVPFRRVPAARAHRSPAATAQRSQIRPTPSLRSVALVGVVEPCRSRRRPAPRRIVPRRGQPERPEHPRDRRRIVDRRQHAPRARALRADQHVDAERAQHVAESSADQASAGGRWMTVLATRAGAGPPTASAAGDCGFGHRGVAPAGVHRLGVSLAGDIRPQSQTSPASPRCPHPQPD
jgi:hypothetical protein